MALSRVIAKRSKQLGDWTFESLRPLSLGWKVMVTSWKESGLPTATSCREARCFSHPVSISARISRNNLAANFARILIVFSAGKTPQRTSPASMPRGNASRGVQLVIAAAAEGMQAAFAINSALLDADAASNALRDHKPGQPTPPDRITSGQEVVD